MKNFINSVIAIAIIIMASCGFANAGNSSTKKAPQKSNVTNPYYNPNKKIINANNQPIFKRNRKAGEPIINRRDQPFFNVKHAPKRFQK